MFNPYGDEQNFNRFVLISVVLHAIVFLTYPQWSSLFISDTPGLGDGGVIQILDLSTNVSPLLSPVTSPISQSTRPRVTEPRPQPGAPEAANPVVQPQPPEVQEVSAPQPSPTPNPVPEEPNIPASAPEPEVPTPTPPAPEAQPASPAPAEAEEGPGELLTSEHGQEVVVAEEEPGREIVTPPTQPQPEPQELPAREENVGASGSGTGMQGEDDDAGISQSGGTGEAESAPPPPPPPPTGRMLAQAIGNRSIGYPKDAMHNRLEGTVHLAFSVSPTGQLEVEIVESSGHLELDMQALYEVRQWPLPPEAYSGYRNDVWIECRDVNGQFVTNYRIGEESQWINAP